MTANNKKEAEKPKKTKAPTALKRDLQNEKKHLRNRSLKSKVRTALVSLQKGISDKEPKEQLDPKLNKIYSLMDKGVKKGIYKKNKAARVKSNLASKATAPSA